MIGIETTAFPDHALDSPAAPSRPQLAVSGAIFRDGKVLLVRRARSPGKGFYSFPGGRVEFGESLHTALHHEVDEETGLRIEILGLAGWREVLPGAGVGGHYLVMTFAARWTAWEPVLNHEHDDFKWLAPDGLGDRRARMIAGFNRGYNGFQQTYRTCTPAASVAIRRYIEEGSKISRDLTARYAN